MSDDKTQVETAVEEEKAPELPTSEPPKEETKTEVAEPVPSADGEAVAAETAAPADENKEEKKPSRLKKRLTLKWGKNRDQAEAPKEAEQPADPKENPIAWVSQQIPAAAHKVNHLVLQWIQQVAVPEESERQALPGKEGQVTRNQFLAYLRDGKLLTKLANALDEGAIEEAKTDSENQSDIKAVQEQNVESFCKWVNEKLNTEESKQLNKAQLVDNGKAGYAAVFETLWNLGLQAQEKFSKAGIDVDSIVAAANSVVRTNIIGMILSFFRRSRRPSVEKKEEEKPEADATNAPEGEQVEEEACQKIDNATASATPAVAAN